RIFVFLAELLKISQDFRFFCELLGNLAGNGLFLQEISFSRRESDSFAEVYNIPQGNSRSRMRSFLLQGIVFF
ncbi:MAG TPA: hypothetical protein VIM79_16965, partial [Niastella sp.]